ncbi:MAG: cytochrome c [Verrucomicrobiae bacterium]|nr:cytochrome c [Verrucomicrobiae bacterium]
MKRKLFGNPLRIAVCLAMLATGAICDAVELVSSNPGWNDHNVPRSSSIYLRFSEPLDVSSLDGLTLHGPEGDVFAEFPVQRTAGLTTDLIELKPVEFLRANVTYEVRGVGIVKSATGEDLKPFQLRFATGDIAFDTSQSLTFVPEVFDQTRSMTTVLFGPDRRLYAADAFGKLYRYDLDKNGTPINRVVILSDPTTSRQYIDLEWDPEATADNLILWTSFSERLMPEGHPDRFFTGKISRLEIDGQQVKENIMVNGLPHGREVQGGEETLPHQPNGLVFRDGMLYQSVGTTSSTGGTDNWGIEEQVLSGCIIEIDYKRIVGPLDVRPSSSFDPYLPGSLLRIYATGVRNALELVDHSNGHLYTAVNMNDRQGPINGVPDDPDIPGDQNLLINQRTPDHESLYMIEWGRHYGCPNSSREQYVLNGGNPTEGPDPYEISDYPVGTQPEAGFAPELMYPIWRWGGTSPNGMIEYAPAFPHPLARTLICCFYSANKMAVMTLGSDGLPVAIDDLKDPQGNTLFFSGTLDVTQDPETGFLYIASFGKQNRFGEDGFMVMLRPALRGETLSAGAKLAVVSDDKLSEKDFGRKVYESQCLMCHQLNGEGMQGSFPPLAGSEWVLGDKRLGINIVLGGLSGPITVKGETFNSVMAPWGMVLNDQQIAAVLTYVRSSWGNDTSAVTEADVAAERASHGGRTTLWTSQELAELFR